MSRGYKCVSAYGVATLFVSYQTVYINRLSNKSIYERRAYTTLSP